MVAPFHQLVARARGTHISNAHHNHNRNGTIIASAIATGTSRAGLPTPCYFNAQQFNYPVDQNELDTGRGAVDITRRQSKNSHRHHRNSKQNTLVKLLILNYCINGHRHTLLLYLYLITVKYFIILISLFTLTFSSSWRCCVGHLVTDE